MTRSACLALGALLLVVSAGRAAAEEDDHWDRTRTDLGVGMLVGGFDVGPVGGAAIGVHFDIGRVMGPLYLGGEYNLLSIGESGYNNDNPIRGTLNRIGLLARYRFVEGAMRNGPLGGGGWLEAGFGRQYIDWNGGGRLHRNDVAFGFGAQMDIMVGRDKPHPKTLGVFYAFRATVTDGPDSEQMLPPTCAGPCDEETPPSPYDLGLFFNLGFTWGT